MALQFVGGATSTGSNSTFSINLNSGLTGGIASAVQAGDIVIAVEGWSSASDDNPGVTTSGYTEVADLYANDTRDINLSVNYKVMGGTPDTNVTFSSSGSTAITAFAMVYVIRGADITSPIDVTSTTATNTNSPAANSPSISPKSVGAWVISVGAGSSDTAASTITAPASHTNTVTVNATNATSGRDSQAGISRRAWSNSGAEDPSAWGNFDSTTTAAEAWAAVTMAIRPADAAVATFFASSVTSMPVNLPPNIATGDLILAWSEVRNPGTWTMPSGWTEFAAQTGGGGGVGELTAFYKIADGTEGATATWTASVSTTAVWHVDNVTDWHRTTPPEATTSSGDSSSADPPSLTPSWGSADTIWFAVAGHAAASSIAFSAAPTNYGDFGNSGASSGGSAASIATSHRINTSSSEDPGTFTVLGSNRFWSAMTVAVRPAASGSDAEVPVAATSYTLAAPSVTVATQSQPITTPSSLGFTLSAPIVGVVSQEQPTVTPSAVGYSLAAPDVTVSIQIQASPAADALSYQLAAPSVSVSSEQNPIAVAEALAYSLAAPNVTVDSQQQPTAELTALALMLTAPSVAAISQQQPTISASALGYLLAAPTVTVSTQAQSQTEVEALSFLISAPGVSVVAQKQPTVVLNALGYVLAAPTVVVETSIQPTVLVEALGYLLSAPNVSIVAQQQPTTDVDALALLLSAPAVVAIGEQSNTVPTNVLGWILAAPLVRILPPPRPGLVGLHLLMMTRMTALVVVRSTTPVRPARRTTLLSERTKKTRLDM